jgi:hypothetical protein
MPRSRTRRQPCSAPSARRAAPAGGENRGYYRIGFQLDRNGVASGGWSDPIAIPGWFGGENQGGGVAVADLSGNGRPDLFIFHVDNPGGENAGYYRVVYDLMPNGQPARWTLA